MRSPSAGAGISSPPSPPRLRSAAFPSCARLARAEYIESATETETETETETHTQTEKESRRRRWRSERALRSARARGLARGPASIGVRLSSWLQAPGRRAAPRALVAPPPAAHGELDRLVPARAGSTGGQPGPRTSAPASARPRSGPGPVAAPRPASESPGTTCGRAAHTTRTGASRRAARAAPRARPTGRRVELVALLLRWSRSWAIERAGPGPCPSPSRLLSRSDSSRGRLSRLSSFATAAVRRLLGSRPRSPPVNFAATHIHPQRGPGFEVRPAGRARHIYIGRGGEGGQRGLGVRGSPRPFPTGAPGRSAACESAASGPVPAIWAGAGRLKCSSRPASLQPGAPPWPSLCASHSSVCVGGAEIEGVALEPWQCSSTGCSAASPLLHSAIFHWQTGHC